ncbi:MAG: biotin--[acetyl-CoA-carboxylase] ligase [Bacteroidaceae bacterium]|nr:biotin--[acetyl-CoA-carboxylase] ligase [Bacteroidaceae bacterium]
MMSRIKWHRSESIGSTNTYLRELNGGDAAYDYEVAVADFQTAGRGQKGNTWESEQGKNLLFSILAHPHNIKVKEQFYISEAIALAVSDAVIAAIGPEFAGGISVKWSNDVYWKDFKMAGILIENTIQGDRILDTVAGVGLDVNQEVFLSDAPNPISLRNITGREFDRDALLTDIVERFIGYMERSSDNEKADVDRLYRERLYRREGYHPFRDAQGEFEACIEGIRPDGCLMLLTRIGEHRTYEFKQVQFIQNSTIGV